MRIQFSSPNSYDKVKTGGVAVYSKPQALVRNFLSFFHICSSIFKYKAGDKTLYLNKKSFNNNLKIYNIEPLKSKKQEAIENIILQILGTTSVSFFKCSAPFLENYREEFKKLPLGNYFFLFLPGCRIDFKKEEFQKFLDERADVSLPTIIVIMSMSKERRVFQFDELAPDLSGMGKWIHLAIRSNDEVLDLEEEHNAQAISSLKTP